MSLDPPRILVLGLGNDILGDDAVGLMAARRLRALVPEEVEVQESGGAGLDLLDILTGFGCALLLDAIATGQHPPGTVLEFSEADFQDVRNPSPHYAGIPEMLQLARELDIPFPRALRILALEVADPYQIREGLSDAATLALPAFVSRAREIVDAWRGMGPNAVAQDADPTPR